MRAIVREAFGGPEQLKITEVPVPEPGPDDVRINVKAFGINRAETYMRRGTWGDVDRISGIECVGVVDQDPSGQFQPGQTVAAMMGGLGRTRPGSYAEITCAPASNVFALDTDLSWADLAAIPESFGTAWWCLFENLKLEFGHVLLVRGATSALGRAAVSIAADAGAVVIATTRHRDANAAALETLGAGEVLEERDDLSDAIRATRPNGIDRVLDLVGNRTFRDSVRALAPRGRFCQAGFLGGAEPIKDFNPIFDLPSDVHVSFFGSFMLGTDGYPTCRIPMQTIVDRVSTGRYVAKPARVFSFEHVPDAHRVMESNAANGKLVVEV